MRREPALVVREHAEGFEHLPVLAVMGDVAALDQFVDRGADLADRGLEAAQLRLRVLRDQVLHHDAGLVQDDMAEADAVGEGDAALVQRSPQGRAGLGERQRLQLARGDHLRQHHGGGLERLHLLFGVDPPRPVLHDEDAEGVAGPQQRHAEEGVVDLLARLRLVGEGRVRLGVGQRERLGRRGDEADEALARGHRREVDGGAVEAFGGEQFERAVGAHHVDGADLRHHVGGDQR